jgi:hypothetical protein
MQHILDELKALEDRARELKNQNLADVAASAHGKVRQLSEHPDLELLDEKPPAGLFDPKAPADDEPTPPAPAPTTGAPPLNPVTGL